MASMNFPANPTAGQEYPWEDFIYVWDGEKWSTKVTVATETYVKKTGDTMTGNLTIATGASTGQLKLGSNNQTYILSDGADDLLLNVGNGKAIIKALEPPVIRMGTTDHKIYHQGFKPTSADVGAVSKTGDTITGPLIIDSNSIALNLKADATQASLLLSTVGGADNWYVGKGTPSVDDITLHSYIHNTNIVLKSDHVRFNKDPRSAAAQGSDAMSLTRKDYVDGNFVSKAGDTIDGQLKVLNTGASAGTDIVSQGVDGGIRMINAAGHPMFDVICNSSSGELWISKWDGAGAWEYPVIRYEPSNNRTLIRNPTTESVQGTSGDALTRKDYVDATLLEVRESLEAKITALMARIEALEAQVNPAP